MEIISIDNNTISGQVDHVKCQLTQVGKKTPLISLLSPHTLTWYLELWRYGKKLKWRVSLYKKSSNTRNVASHEVKIPFSIKK